VRAVGDASVLDFGVFTYVANIEGEVADVRDEVRPGRNKRDRKREDGGNERGGFHNNELYGTTLAVARTGLKPVHGNLIKLVHDFLCR